MSIRSPFVVLIALALSAPSPVIGVEEGTETTERSQARREPSPECEEITDLIVQDPGLMHDLLEDLSHHRCPPPASPPDED